MNIPIPSRVYKSDKFNNITARVRRFITFMAFSAISLVLSNLTVTAATFTVTKVADTSDGICDADCSLREAVGAANSAASDDIVNFDSSFSIFTLTILLSGQLDLLNNGQITINGPGTQGNQFLLNLSGNDMNRIFNVQSQATVNINGVRIINARTGAGIGGGAILNDGGMLTLNQLKIENCVAGGPGGVLYSTTTANPTAQVTISNSSMAGSSSLGNGGAIYSTSRLTMNVVTIGGNVANGINSIGGGIYFTGQGDLTTVSMTGNSASKGGAIYCDGCNATLTGLEIVSNTATTGGGLYLDGNATISGLNILGNTASSDGGGVYKASGTLSILNTQIVSNRSTASRGGGIFVSSGNTNITGTTFTNNSTSLDGAGIYNSNGNLSILGSTFDQNNSSVDGGGILIVNGDVTVFNSTFRINRASVSGGGIRQLAGTLEVTNSTVVENVADNDSNGTGSGGGISFPVGVTVNIRNNIFANNISNGGPAPDISGIVASLGHNLVKNLQGVTGLVVSDIVNQDPNLLPFNYYGGPTRTYPLGENSPALDSADPLVFPATDQRGVVRPQDGDLNGTSLPDIGAYEMQIIQYQVNKTADTNDGVCDSDCSLREAVAAFNTGTTPDNAITFDLSVFNVARTIALTGGSITISGNRKLYFEGTGMSLLSVDCSVNSAVVIGSVANVTMKNVTMTGPLNGTSGRIYNSGGGKLTLINTEVKNSGQSLPGVWNVGTVTIINSFLRGNQGNGLYNDQGIATISNSDISSNWGGIYNDRGTMTVSGTTIATNAGTGLTNFEGTSTLVNVSIINNTKATGNGGGIVNATSSATAANVTITNSTITGNTVNSGAGGAIANSGTSITISKTVIASNRSMSSNGGGIYNLRALNITDSSITGNAATLDGGGVYNSGTGAFSNVTISNNTAMDQGGGFYNEGSTFALNFTTVASNSARQAGGIYSAGGVNLRSSIIGDNSGSDLTIPAPDYFGPLISQGYNLVENTANTAITGVTSGNILGRDPQLTALRDNGGTSNTRALQPLSPAIDAGDPVVFPPADQRGVARPQDGDINGSVRADIGAYERQTTLFIVTKVTDTNDGLCDADCSLREAVAVTNSATTPDNVILFAPAVFGTQSTITLSGTDLEIFNSPTLLINGPGPGMLTISGNGQSRVFSVYTISNVAISGVTITGGNGIAGFNSGWGGGVYNDGSALHLANSVVTGNAGQNGGGIASLGGTMMITSSLVNSNIAVNNAGGIFNQTVGSLTVANSSVSNNAAASAGGIDNRGQLVVQNSVISNNNGSGIRNFTGAIGFVSGSTIDSNRLVTNSTNGAGIYNLGTLTVSGSTISRNSTTGVFSTGGGLFSTSTLTLNNSTVSGNMASGTAGIETSGTLNLNFVTIVRNISTSTTDPGGVKNTAGTVNAKNCLIADNFTSSPANSPDFQGALASLGYNLIKNASGATITGTTTGNLLNIDPRIDPILRSNGGGVETHALRIASPIVDKGALVTGILTDQRGFTRPVDFPTITNASGGNGSDVGAFERQTNDIVRTATPFDLDGDGRTDISIFRPTVVTGAEWWWLKSSNGSNAALQFGVASDKLAPVDFTGDGKTDIAFWRPSTGEWYVLRSEDFSFYAFPFGSNGDIPAPADYDGDGKADAAVFRESAATWYINKSSGGTDIVGFGAAGDKPVNADFDGDGKSDIAIFRPNGVSGAEWWVRRSSNSSVFALQFGTATDNAIPGDYTGDGKADVAFWRPSTGFWSVLRSEDFSYFAFPFGSTNDLPVPGDYDGDGKLDAAVFRPSNSTWYANRSNAGVLIQQFGIAGDLPLPNAFVR